MAKHPRILAGKVVAITGGARGIGRTTAQACVHAGMKVAIGDVDPQAAEQTAAELGANVLALPLDVTDHASFRSFIDAVDERLGPLDVLINNAGIMPLGPFIEESDATAQAHPRHQRARRDQRDEVRAPGHDGARARAHREHRVAGGQVRVPGRRDVLREQGGRDQPQPRGAQGIARARGSTSRS